MMDMQETMARAERQIAFIGAELPFEETIRLMSGMLKSSLWRRLEDGYVLCAPEEAGAVQWHEKIAHHGGVEITVSHWMRPA